MDDVLSSICLPALPGDRLALTSSKRRFNKRKKAPDERESSHFIWQTIFVYLLCASRTANLLLVRLETATKMTTTPSLIIILTLRFQI